MSFILTFPSSPACLVCGCFGSGVLFSSIRGIRKPYSARIPEHGHPPREVITPGANAFRQCGLVQRSGGSVLLLKEEAQHLAAGIRPARVGVGASWAAA
jgi:hypothetical protein